MASKPGPRQEEETAGVILCQPTTTTTAAGETAEQINQARPQWLVLWGLYSRRFWAFPLFDMRPRMLVYASYPDTLIDRMDAAEHRYRIHPEGVTGDDTDTP